MVRAKKIEITQGELKKVFDYDMNSGEVLWGVRASNTVKIGDVAGSLHHSGYLHILYKRKQYLAHRLIWLYVHGEIQADRDIDHRDGDKTNNRISNLRLCTTSENQRNRKMQWNNKSGFKGVSWDKQCQKWHVRPSLNGKRIHLGFYLDKEEATAVYKAFCLEHHGEFYKDTTKQTCNLLIDTTASSLE